jgi:hypothetical protein
MGKEYHVFASYGGYGSSFLIKSLRKNGYAVGTRPDLAFRHPNDFTLQGKAYPYSKKIKAEEVYQQFPKPGNYRKFRKRSGFKINLDITLERNLLNYLLFLHSKNKRAAVFSAAYRYKFFSRHQVRNVVFLVRQPMSAYLSYAKPQRHGHVINAMGGLYSEKSIKWFGEIWVALVSEYFRLRAANLAPVLIRFEYAKGDSKKPGLYGVFKDYDSTKKNYSKNKKASKLMNRITGKLYRRLY